MTDGTRMSPESSAPVRAVQRTVAVAPALIAIALGLFILFGTGFTQPDALHNAAHDARHAFAFPCH